MAARYLEHLTTPPQDNGCGELSNIVDSVWSNGLANVDELEESMLSCFSWRWLLLAFANNLHLQEQNAMPTTSGERTY